MSIYIPHPFSAKFISCCVTVKVHRCPIGLVAHTDDLMFAVSGCHVHGGVVKPFLDDCRSVAARDQITRIRPYQRLDRLLVTCKRKKKKVGVEGRGKEQGERESGRRGGRKRNAEKEGDKVNKRGR